MNIWTKSQEELLKKWHTDSVAFVWKHTQAAKSFYLWDRILGLPTVIVNTITGTALFVSLYSQGDNNNNVILQSILGTIILVTAILSGMHNFLRYAELAEKHKNSANRFNSYTHSIETELVLRRAERVHPKIFLKQAQKRFAELIETCPNISDKIDKSYKNILQDKEIKNLLKVIVDDEQIENQDNEDTDKSSLQKEYEKELQSINIKDNIKDNISDISKNNLERFSNFA